MNPLWTDLSQRAAVALDQRQADLLSRYLDLLLEANHRMNLTRIADRAAAEVHHVADSLTLLPHLPAGPHRLADVGSGGGAPGIPLAIARPDARVVLIEATKKKAAFLSETAEKLALANVTVCPRRAEDAGREPATRETFDVAVARAVGALVWLAEWCLPLVKKGGKVLAMKGAKLADELPAAAKAIRLLGGGPPLVHKVQDLPGAEHHVIVEISKIAKTPPKYPRPATEAESKPLP